MFLLLLHRSSPAAIEVSKLGTDLAYKYMERIGVVALME